MENFDVYTALQPESREMIKANHPHFRKGEPFEETIHMKDRYGRDRWFRIHSTCVDSIADDPIYLTVFIDIITELRELQAKLEERTRLLHTALEEAKQANSAKSDFLSRMSHDIRTSMNAIVGMTEIASSHLGEPERMRDCLQKIRLSSHHLLGLINDVLDMSKIESGEFPINLAPLSLPDMLREVIMITLPNVRSRRQIFDVHLIELEREQFTSDALRLRQILPNLLSNASKFTPEGGQIVFDVEQLAGEAPEATALRFTVSDSGSGMKPEFLEHLFDAFARERDSRIDRIEGSGLGMAITKRLAELLGRSIKVRSRLGVGTQFQVTLPMHSASVHTAQPPAPGASILLVDDDPIVLKYGRKALEALGAEAECAASGEEAVRRFRESGPGHYALVLMDIQMPVMNGYDATRAIRALSRSDAQTVPVVAMTADDFVEDIKNAKDAGMNGHISKSLDFQTLAREINGYLGFWCDLNCSVKPS